LPQNDRSTATGQSGTTATINATNGAPPTVPPEISANDPLLPTPFLLPGGARML